MPDEVIELLLTEAALDKLGARNISPDEAGQLLRNAHLVVRNPPHLHRGAGGCSSAAQMAGAA